MRRDWKQSHAPPLVASEHLEGLPRISGIVLFLPCVWRCKLWGSRHRLSIFDPGKGVRACLFLYPHLEFFSRLVRSELSGRRPECFSSRLGPDWATRLRTTERRAEVLFSVVQLRTGRPKRSRKAFHHVETHMNRRAIGSFPSNRVCSLHYLLTSLWLSPVEKQASFPI